MALKNVLILGVARAGKTTLARMIKEKYPHYNLIHSDSIKWALIRAEDKEKYFRENIDVQCKFETSEYFQKVLLEFFNSCIKRRSVGFQDCGHIMESGQLTPELVKQFIDFENTMPICLGHGELDANGIYNLCKTHDKEHDWSFGLPDDKLRINSYNWSEQNKLLKQTCAKYGVRYIDTSKNREKVLSTILDGIEKTLNNGVVKSI